MNVGQKHTVEEKVIFSNTAIHVGSGDVEVYATPMMVALMEKAAAGCIAKDLQEGKTSVGGSIQTSHVSASPVGATITATAEITAFTEKKVEFKVVAMDDGGLIGEGIHTRFIVTKESFQERAKAKLIK